MSRSFRPEQRRAADAEAVKPVLADHAQRAEAVLQAAAEIDAAGFLKVADGDGDVAEAEAETHRLDQKLCVEDEIVGVFLEGDALEHGFAVDAEAAVEIAEILAQRDVLHAGQKAIAEVLV